MKSSVVKTPEQIEKMAVAGSIVADLLAHLRGFVGVGVTTKEVDAEAARFIDGAGATPLFLGYKGPGVIPFPGVVCLSVNEEVVHGIPGKRVLKDGDILGIDCGVRIDGWCGDAAVTVPIGKIPWETKRLLEVTEESLRCGIAQMVSGHHLSDICGAVQRHLESHGYGVVREFTGHGIGRELHEHPSVPNYLAAGSRGMELKVGMVFAIEPMANLGTHAVEVLSDGWTVVTRDRKLSAHYEHTVAITESGPRVLTLPKKPL